jgi:hypothetical protein
MLPVKCTLRSGRLGRTSGKSLHFPGVAAPEPAPSRATAVKGNGPLEKEDDGVVAYTSASIDGTESTRVIHSGHSAQETPEGIVDLEKRNAK